MEKTRLTTDPLFLLYEPLLEGLGLFIVDIVQKVRGTNVQLDVDITRKDREPDSKDCDSAYHAIYPVAVEEAGPLRDVYLTVSTPGLQRNIKDAHEFSLFTGRSVKVYDTGRCAWLVGTIAGFDGTTLQLDSVRIGEDAETVAHVAVDVSKIQKARLEYREEDWKDGR